MSVAAHTQPDLPPSAGARRLSLSELVRQRLSDLRGGELGSLPIIVGIVVIAIYFQTRNAHFLTAGNFVNLIAQMAALSIIGMGVVFVLLLGEIDLSIGYVSGMGGVIAAVLLEPGKGVPTWAAVALALGVGASIGLFQGFFVAKLGVPSFVVTLAGLLGWNGVVLQIIGNKGTIIIQDKFVNNIANGYVAHWLSWAVAIGSVAAYAGQHAFTVFRRRQAGLPNQPAVLIGARVAVLAGFAPAVEPGANSDPRLPYVALGLLYAFI